MTAATGGRDRRLRLDDIEDLRAYERGRETFRRQIIDLKRRRRVALGPIVSIVFENRETIRSQVQEMARAERMVSDAEIQQELDVYNPLIPEPGELSATMFIELSGEDALRQWLPRLVGIERSVRLEVADAGTVPGFPEENHEEALTRGDITASVHYVRFALDAPQVERFGAGPVELIVAHPAYRHRSALSDEVRQELLTDLRS
jgi:hypothetical protein